MNDDDLRDHLHHADPAASLRSLPDTEVSALFSRVTRVPARRNVWMPVAASFLIVAAAISVFVGAFGGAFGTQKGIVSDDEPIIARVGVASEPAPDARCGSPRVEDLRGVGLAVEAKVQDSQDHAVTLVVIRTFAGAPVDELQVGPAGGDTEGTLAGAGFVVGTTYLLAIDDGIVLGCGYSGAASPELRELYDEAF